MVAAIGTPEAAWQECGEVLRWPELPLGDCPTAVVVAPHPDDEVLGVGGLVAMLVDKGIPVLLVAATDGEGSHPGSPTHTRSELAARRLRESEAVWARMR